AVLRTPEGGHIPLHAGRRGARHLAAWLAVALGEFLDLVQNVRDLLAQWLWVDAVFLVIGNLLRPAPLSLVDRVTHRLGDVIGIHDDLTRDVSGGTANRLDQRTGGAQEALLIRIQDRDQGD